MHAKPTALKQASLVALIVIAALFTGCSRESKTTTKTNGSTAVARQKADKDAVFKEDKPFDAASYTGGINVVTTPGDNTASIALVVKDGTDFKAYGELEISGNILLGAEGLLAYTDTFRRIKLVKGDSNWKDIGRKAIRNGRLFIETKGDMEVFTISGFSASQHTAVVEPGIHYSEPQNSNPGIS
jgi:hypothetical protein